MKLYNSLSRTIEEFVPIDEERKKVSIYTCGPTVYDYVTIGNWRTYTLSDLVVRTLTFLGYETNYVMNMTDVGHLTGDNLGDSSSGEDRLEKGAKREGKTAWEIADFYGKDFLEGYKTLKLTEPKKFTKATEYLAEQIRLVQQIEERGFVYAIEDDGVYFDTRAYEAAGYSYGELSNIDEVKEGARVEPNPNKRDPRDFALWKFSPKGEKRHMEWKSPWGVGFPGWHIECSAMIMAELGEQIDIHMGGEDLRSTHHPNEIAQSESATGKHPFVKYWVHGAFLQVDGGRMGKSLGNAYTLHDVMQRGFHPLALKYFYMTGHYRKPLNFTWEGLQAAQEALNKIWKEAERFGEYTDFSYLTDRDPSEQILLGIREIQNALSDDLNFPKAIGLLHETIGKHTDDHDVMYLLDKTDALFGLEFRSMGKERFEEWQLTNVEFKSELDRRAQLRAEKLFEEADQIRHTIEGQGFEVLDTPDGPLVRRKARLHEEQR